MNENRKKPIVDEYPGEPTEISAALAASIRPRLFALARHVLDFWISHGVDEAYGGFHGKLDRSGHPVPSHVKGSIQQARHLFALCIWTERRERTPLIEKTAAHTYRLLVERFRDPEDKEYYFMVNPTGGVSDAAKLLYAQGFAIYGLSTFGRVFKYDEALELALDCFNAIERRAHDDEHGGYDEAGEPEWLTNGGRKDTNTHIHLMEAFTSLVEATGDELARARLKELVSLISTKLLQPGGYVHQQFALDWSPIKEPAVSYGHDIETTWLLMEAERVLGRCDPAVKKAAVTMGANAVREGFDENLGGFFDHGVPGVGVVGTEKVWWAQFEGLAGLFWLFRLTGEVEYLQRMARTLDWLEGPARDTELGEWYWGVMPNGDIGPFGDMKGDPWKTMYHNLRGLVFTEDWLSEWMAH